MDVPMVKRVADDMRMTWATGSFCRFQEIPRFKVQVSRRRFCI